MRKLIFILLAIIGVSQAQTIQYIGAPTTTVISRGNFRTDSIFYLPKRTKLPTDTAALRYQISDSSLYAWTGSQWRKVGADPDSLIFSTRAWRQKGDDSLAARINLKVNISDTASMLTPYLRKADTTAMLSPYYRSATATAALATKLNISDTSTMLSPYARTATVNASLATKLNISDTSSMLGNYVRHAGYGLTKSGQSFLVDTLNIATRAWRQKGIDSVAGLSRIGGSGTTNYVPKFTGLTTLGNSIISDNGTSVFIGGSGEFNNAGELRWKSTAGTGQNVLMMFSDDNVYLSAPVASSNLIFRGVGFAERMRITSGGNVGIGTTSPAVKLDVSQASTGSVVRFQGDAALLRYLEFKSVDVGAFTGAGWDRNVNSASGFHSWSTAGTERLRITSSGDVGIGTTSPAVKLDVTGSGVVGRYTSTSNAVPISIYNTGTSISTIGFKGSTSTNDFNVRVGADANDYIAYTNNTERLRIFANGRVGINTTTDAGYQLDINGTLRSVNGANFATTSGNVGVGITADNPLGSGGTYRNLMVGNGAGYGAFQGVSTATAAGSTLAAFMGGTTGASSSFKTAGYMAVELDGTSTTNATGRITFTVGQSTGAYLEAMRITSSGELLINTTSDAGDYKLQVAGNIYNTGSAVLAATSGNVGIGVTPSAWNSSWKAVEIQQSGNAITSAAVNSVGITSNAYLDATNWKYGANGTANFLAVGNTDGSFAFYKAASGTAGNTITFTQAMTLNNASELLLNTTSDAGDYKLQVSGNALVTAGKLDIATNTTFGLGVARSGTSEVAGQIYNSNGILYLGAESSAGGQIFSGSSAYAAVIGSGANYPLQFATNNATRATIDTDGDLGIATATPTEKLDVNGRARIRTIDSTSTAINLLYADVDGVIKKAPVSASGISGSGTTNYIPKFTSSSALGNSILYENNSELFINTTSDQGNYKLQVNGTVYNTSQITRGTMNIIGYDAQIFIDSTKDLAPIFIGQHQITTASAQPTIYANTTWNTTGSPTMLSFDVINTASGADANWLRISDGAQVFKITKDGGLFTGTPTGGSSKKWRLGSAATVSPTSPNRTIQVEVDGVIYYLHAKTTND